MDFDTRDFRNALGSFATGVCVISVNPEGAKPFGMTVNSFASVSLDPPLVLWSLQKDSDCFDLFDQTNHFAVNVLAHDQQHLSNQYAKKGDHALDDGSFRIGNTGCVVLKQAMNAFECRIEARHEGGDHIIIVGRVLTMFDHPAGKKPLVFHRGSYRELK